MDNIDKRGIAARLRRLMTAPADQVARWLNVSEAALRAAIQKLAPRPTVEIVVAAAIHYGVDPAWILAGDYDADALRAAAEGDLDATTSAVLKMIRTAELDGGESNARSASLQRPDEPVFDFSRATRHHVTVDRADVEPAPRTRSPNPTDRRSRDAR